MSYSPILISLKIGLISTIINLFLGTYMAYKVNKMDKIKYLIDGLLTLPLVLPPTITGFLLLILLGNNGFIGKFLSQFNKSIIFTPTATIISATIVAFPLMYRSIRGALENLNKDLINAGKTLGLSNFEILRKIMLPNIYPNVISASILTFARSIGEFGATIMIAGNIPGKTQTMSLAIYTAVQTGNRELAYKWVIIMVLISLISVIFINNLNRGERDFKS